MKLQSSEGARQSEGKPGSLSPRIMVVWWVWNELKCQLWTHSSIDPWSNNWASGSGDHRENILVSYSSKCRDGAWQTQASDPSLLRGRYILRAFKKRLKEPALAIAKNRCALCLPRMTRTVVGCKADGFCCWPFRTALVRSLALFSLLSVWIFSSWAERSWFTLGTTWLWSQRQMPDAAGIQRNNESNTKCVSQQ